MLDTEERYGDDRHTQSYPKCKLLLEFDDEAVPTKSNTTRRPEVPLHNRNKSTTKRSIYGSKGHTPTRDYGHQNDEQAKY